jgi:hypothetical protein
MAVLIGGRRKAILRAGMKSTEKAERSKKTKEAHTSPLYYRRGWRYSAVNAKAGHSQCLWARYQMLQAAMRESGQKGGMVVEKCMSASWMIDTLCAGCIRRNLTFASWELQTCNPNPCG